MSQSTFDVRWDMPRLRAMYRQCRNVDAGRSCFCEFGCKAQSAIQSAITRRQAEVTELESMLRELTATPATLRSDWKRPSPPQVGYFLAVYNDGDGWFLHWQSDELTPDVIEIEGPDSWPWNEDTARVADWQRIGVNVFN